MWEFDDSILERLGTSSVESFYAAMWANALLGFALLCLFTLLHRFFPWLYAPKISSPASAWAFQEKFCDSSCLLAPAPPLKSFWLWSSLFITEETVLATAGLDAYMFIRVYNFGRDVFVLLSFIGIVVLMPEFSQGASQLESLQSISMSNIQPGEHLYDLFSSLFSLLFSPLFSPLFPLVSSLFSSLSFHFLFSLFSLFSSFSIFFSLSPLLSLSSFSLQPFFS